MDNLRLGQIITTNQNKDAIHVAVAPVVATERLAPGQHVGSDGDEAGPSKTPIGIVDPFLAGPVFKGERFWLFLYPGSITSLRHEWTHPAFSVSPALNAEPSERWIEGFAESLDKTYAQLMADARRWVEEEEFTIDNTETYKGLDPSLWKEFWAHYQIVTGTPVSDCESSFYTCRC